MAPKLSLSPVMKVERSILSVDLLVFWRLNTELLSCCLLFMFRHDYTHTHTHLYKIHSVYYVHDPFGGRRYWEYSSRNKGWDFVPRGYTAFTYAVSLSDDVHLLKCLLLKRVSQSSSSILLVFDIKIERLESQVCLVSILISAIRGGWGRRVESSRLDSTA